MLEGEAAVEYNPSIPRRGDTEITKRGWWRRNTSGRPKWQLRGREPQVPFRGGDVASLRSSGHKFAPNATSLIRALIFPREIQPPTPTTNDPTNFVNFASVRQVGRDPPLLPFQPEEE